MVENPALAYHLPSVIIITNLFFSSWLWAFVDRTRFSPLQLKHLRKCLIQSQYSTSVDEKTGWVLKLHYILGYNFLGRGFNCLVQFIRSLVSDSLWPHGLQHTRPPCPSPTPGAHSNSCPLSWWCHPTISSSVIPFYSCLLSFQASGYFPAGWFFISGSQSIVALAAASVPPVNLFRVDFL